VNHFGGWLAKAFTTRGVREWCLVKVSKHPLIYLCFQVLPTFSRVDWLQNHVDFFWHHMAVGCCHVFSERGDMAGGQKHVFGRWCEVVAGCSVWCGVEVTWRGVGAMCFEWARCGGGVVPHGARAVPRGGGRGRVARSGRHVAAHVSA
jgi:hypothetical protein